MFESFQQSSPSSVAMLVVYMRRGEDAGWGFRADQVRRLGFLVGHRKQALQSLTEIRQLRKNAVKADTCLFVE